MALLQYDFRTINENVVHTALASIERRVARHNAIMSRTLGSPVARGSRSIATTGRTVSDKIVHAEQRQAAQVALYWARAAQRSADFRIRQEERAHRAKLAMVAKEQRAVERAAAAQFRADQRFAAAERRERANVARGILGRSGRSISGSLGAVAGTAGTALGLAGTFAVGSALQTRISESAQASRLANAAGRPELKGTLLREAQGVQGFTGAETMGALAAFQGKTGELDTGRQALGTWGELALATGTRLEDLGETSGHIFNALKKQITDPVERLRLMNETLGVLAQQGRMGSVEMSDLARDFGKLGAATRAFEGGPGKLMRSMGAFAQIATESGGAEGSADASTAASRLASDIVTNRKRFKALGVDVVSKTDKSKLRAPEEIMMDVLQKTGGDITKTSGLFGMESAKIFRGMAATFTAAEEQEKGSGRRALEAEFNRFAGANLDPAEIKKQAQSQLDEPELRFKEATKEFNNAVGRELLPVLTRLVPEFTKLIPNIAEAAKMFAGFVEEAAKNPMGTLFKVIAAKLALDIASAGIGASVKSALERLIMGSGGAIPLPGGGRAPLPGGAPGGAGGGAGVALAATAAIGSTIAFVDQANSLQQMTGTKHSLADVLPGMGGGKFDPVRALGDVAGFLANPGQHFIGRGLEVGGNVGAGIMQFDEREELGARLRYLNENQMFKNLQPQKIEGGEQLVGAAEKLSDAADKLSKSAVNRSDKPSDPTKG